MSQNLICTLQDSANGKTLMKLTKRQAQALYVAGLIYQQGVMNYFLDDEATVKDCQEALAACRQTNVEFVTGLMEHSRRGALAQGFVIQALDQYSKAVASVGPGACDSPLVSGQAWHDCAVEIQEKLKARLS